MGRREERRAARRAGERPSSAAKARRVPPRKTASLSPRAWGEKMKGIPCFILGNAPSLNKVDLTLLDSYFTVGINRIFFKYDPTILLWQDLALWSQEKQKVVKTQAIKYCRAGSETQGGYYTFILNGREPKLTADVTKLYGRGSSGSIAYQFVYALGCDPIILVGMDCRNAKDGTTDFYGNNSMHRAHTLPACVKGLKFIRDHSKGKTIINCSRNKVFPERKTIEEVIPTLGDQKYSREQLVAMLMG
jgi:hypothetical protein